MPIVEIHIFPPLSYKMTSKRVGALIIKKQIQPDTTLVDLLDRLDEENHDAWQKLYNRNKKKMRPPVTTILNGKALSPSVLVHTVLTDGDQIKLILVFAGG